MLILSCSYLWYFSSILPLVNCVDKAAYFHNSNDLQSVNTIVVKHIHKSFLFVCFFHSSFAWAVHLAAVRMFLVGSFTLVKLEERVGAIRKKRLRTVQWTENLLVMDNHLFIIFYRIVMDYIWLLHNRYLGFYKIKKNNSCLNVLLRELQSLQDEFLNWVITADEIWFN